MDADNMESDSDREKAVIIGDEENSTSPRSASKRQECDDDFHKRRNLSKIQATSKGDSPPRKRRKIVRKVKEDVVHLSDVEKLAETVGVHIGKPINRTFDELSFYEKEDAGPLLASLLDLVADGSLNSLMHHTLKEDLMKKLVLGRGQEFLPAVLKEDFGISDDAPFPLMSEGEKEDIGRRLGSLLRKVAGGALVPLLNSTLNADEVRKLSSLKGIMTRGAEDEDTIDDEEMREEMSLLVEANADVPDSQAQNLGSVFDSLKDEVVLRIIKEVVRRDAPLKEYPPLRSPRLSALGSPKYNHDLIFDVISKISQRFHKLAHDKSLWGGTVMISLDGDDQVDEDIDEWFYGEKRADEIIGGWLHVDTERLWLDGESLVTASRVPKFNFNSLAKRCPKLKTLLLYSVELEKLSSSFRMTSLEDLFMDNVNLVHSDAFVSFDWRLSFPSIIFFGMKPDVVEHGACWSMLPDLRGCDHMKEVNLVGGRYSFPTNILNAVPFPRGLKKLVIRHNGFTDLRSWGKKDPKTMSNVEVERAIRKGLPDCNITYENLGSRKAVCRRLRGTPCLVPRVTRDSEEEEQREGEGENLDEAAAAETPVCAVCGAEAPGKSRCAGCRRVNYCSREHQMQHWKTGGHREACSGTCTRCLKPVSANRGECQVDHPSHLRKGSEFVLFNIGGPTRKKFECLACDKEVTTMDTPGCNFCAEDCGVIVDGPRFCFEGKHTSVPLPTSDKRRVCSDVVTILPSKGNLQEEIEAILCPENEAKVKILNIPNGGCDDKITASIHHNMSNLTTLRIMDVTLLKLHLTAELTPSLLDLEIRNIPENCKFHVVVPTLRTISIHHYSPPDHGSSVINKMLAAATELETFETYKLWVTEELCFASNLLKTIELYRSDGLSGISLWAPNLEELNLRACYSITSIKILKSHQLSKKLPQGHKSSTIRVKTANANISGKAVAALKRSGRCLIEDSGPSDGPLGTESYFQALHRADKFQDDEGEAGPAGLLRMLKAMEVLDDEQVKGTNKQNKKNKKSHKK